MQSRRVDSAIAQLVSNGSVEAPLRQLVRNEVLECDIFKNAPVSPETQEKVGKHMALRMDCFHTGVLAGFGVHTDVSPGIGVHCEVRHENGMRDAVRPVQVELSIVQVGIVDPVRVYAEHNRWDGRKPHRLVAVHPQASSENGPKE